MAKKKSTEKSLKKPMLTVSKVTKKFGNFTANDGIDFEIFPGEIVALLGENGAGKSTLVKMLYGTLQPTSGSILWKGENVTIPNPAKAREFGIGMVFQHFSLFESLSVADNIILSVSGNETGADLRSKILELSAKYGLPLEPDAIIGDLSVGERQRVEIVRCLIQNPDLIILDEPTSVLTPQEAENLFKTIEILRKEGRSILFITHRLDEVRQTCSRATILRYGKVTGECDPKKETAASIARMMVGSDVKSIKRSKKSSTGDALLEAKNLNAEPLSPFAVELKDINLSVHAGEVVGIAGVSGNGQAEFFDVLSGETKVDSGEIHIRGKLSNDEGVNERRRNGAAFVPEERSGHAAVPSMELSKNMLLARHESDAVTFQKWGKIGLISEDYVARAMKRVCDLMDVRKSGDDPAASTLSGGNLQKYVIGRELDRQPSVLIVNQPSWGVDAGAAARIRQALVDLAKSGSAVLVISQDLDEIFEISDRIAAMCHGALSQAFPADKLTREQIGLLMVGEELPTGKTGKGKKSNAA